MARDKRYAGLPRQRRAQVGDAERPKRDPADTASCNDRQAGQITGRTEMVSFDGRSTRHMKLRLSMEIIMMSTLAPNPDPQPHGNEPVNYTHEL